MAAEERPPVCGPGVEDEDDEGEGSDAYPLRFGLTYNPPAIVIEWLQSSSGRLFHRRIKLLDLGPSSDPACIAEAMRQMNEVLLSEHKVCFEQLVALVQRVQLLTAGTAAGSDIPASCTSSAMVIVTVTLEAAVHNMS
uniref:Uncharacterized protein n=1 Tax=Alexandrium monilatum TaxID=311494 RepID=A0A7S4UFU2_9DINO